VGLYRNLELENHKAGILPPAFGRGSMLNLVERTRVQQFDPLTKYQLFECGNVIGTLGSIPQAPNTPNQEPSHSCKKPCINDHSNKQYGKGSTTKTAVQLPALLANGALEQAISQVQIPMEEWEPPHIFKLFMVLMAPPLDLDLNAVNGLCDYLTKLLGGIRGLVENRMRKIASHCWCTLLGKYSTPNFSLI